MDEPSKTRAPPGKNGVDWKEKRRCGLGANRSKKAKNSEKPDAKASGSRKGVLTGGGLPACRKKRCYAAWREIRENEVTRKKGRGESLRKSAGGRKTRGRGPKDNGQARGSK